MVESIKSLEKMLALTERQIVSMQKVADSLKVKRRAYAILVKTLNDMKELQKEESEINNESES